MFGADSSAADLADAREMRCRQGNRIQFFPFAVTGKPASVSEWYGRIAAAKARTIADLLIAWPVLRRSRAATSSIVAA